MVKCLRCVTPARMLRISACVGLVAFAGNGEAAPARRPEEVAWRVEGISAGLGLLQLRVDAGPQVDAAHVSVQQRGEGFLTVPLRREGDGWQARLMAGRESVLILIHVRYLDGRTFETGPVQVSAATSPALATPDWAKGAVWYQVLPDRFRNGNPANDPVSPGAFLMPWTAEWSVVGAEELEAARAVGDRLQNERGEVSLRRALVRRRYGGDLQGVVEKLDDLADLGVTALYFCPVFSAPSLHKYDAADFRHIDPTLAGAGEPDELPSETVDPATWKWTPADRYLLDTVLPEAHRRGIRVILDGVWNHTGTGFWAFRDVLARGRQSAFSEWYQVRFDSRATDAQVNGWRAWNGINGSLPRFSQTAEGDLVPPVKQHVFDVTRRWMDPDGDGDPSDGIDGWRLDVASDIGLPFWADWRAHVRSINPDAYLVGELWYDARDYLRGAAFDAQMNYPFARAVLAWLRGGSAGALGAELSRLLANGAATDLVQMNLLGSHDTQRLASALANTQAPYDSGGAMDAPGHYDRGRPGPEIYDLVVLGTALQATWPGAPMVTWGDEWGTFGGKDPDNRKPLPWPDVFERAPPDHPDRPIPHVRERVARWLRLRAHPLVGPVLRYGDVRLVDSGSERVLVFERSLNEVRVIAVLNAGSETYDANALIPPGSRPIASPLEETAPFGVPARSGGLWLVPRP